MKTYVSLSLREYRKAYRNVGRERGGVSYGELTADELHHRDLALKAQILLVRERFHQQAL